MINKSFRVVRDASTPMTERKVSWAEANPSNAEWAKALAHIDGCWAKSDTTCKVHNT